MFESEELKTHLDTAFTVKAKPRVFAELNLNDPENIRVIGNYRYRPFDAALTYRVPLATYDPQDTGDFYTDNTVSYDEVSAEVADIHDPEQSNSVFFRQDRDSMKMLYSLEDCFNPIRPRSGVNKLLYFPGQYVDCEATTPERPRWYFASKDDAFKYWTSYRMEGTKERGVSYKRVGSNEFFIDDAVPFVVYNESVAANRIVVKMQTGVGTVDMGQLLYNGSLINDPLYGQANQRTPKRWRIEVLRGTSWSAVAAFDGSSTRVDGSPVIGPDGNVEIGYGLTIPDEYKDVYTFRGYLTSTSMLPDRNDAAYGDTYMVTTNSDSEGSFWILLNNDGDPYWRNFQTSYSWEVEQDGFNNASHLVTELVKPSSFLRDGKRIYREFDVIDGVRVVVQTMNVVDAPFDLIEISPRLAMDWTDRASSYNVTKALSDLSNSSVPVGQLIAGTGKISVSNNDLAFNLNNIFDTQDGTGSVIANVLDLKPKVTFYENIYANGMVHFVPIKTMYAETSFSVNQSVENIDVSLRDLYFLLENTSAPSMLITDVSLSRIIMLLMDAIGFTNYVFKRDDSVAEPVIPYFFIPSGMNVADVLQQLALATQSAMFFDEFNNFVVMYKEYLLPSSGSRNSDFVLRGNSDSDGLANIQAVSTADRKVYNGGQIEFTKRAIQRTYANLDQASWQDSEKSWIYSPVMLWEVAAEDATKAYNDDVTTQSAFTLSAFPLNADISAAVPTVKNGSIINNTISVGESINYYSRYKGYLYADGEIIKYDAVQFSVNGELKWITSADEYQNNVLSLPFNGKMYPTGLIRIEAEPFYYTLQDGSVALTEGEVETHGRGQFGTTIVAHTAGIDPYWTTKANVRGMYQEGDLMFSLLPEIKYPNNLQQNVVAGMKSAEGTSAAVAQKSEITSLIKNHLVQQFWTESDPNLDASRKARASLQSSALVITGPDFDSIEPRDHVTYVPKELGNKYTSFGTRMRIVGEVSEDSTSEQAPVGSCVLATSQSSSPDTETSISGGAGGIGVLVNPDTNAGYFFEIAALTSADPSTYTLDSFDFTADMGTIEDVKVVNNHVTLTLRNKIQNLLVGDQITVEGLPSDDTIPNVSGSFVVSSIGEAGGKGVIEYDIPIVSYNYINDMGQIFYSNGTTEIVGITSVEVNDAGVVTVKVANSTTLSTGVNVVVTGFPESGSVPTLNGTVKVTYVDPNKRTFQFNVPQANYDFYNELTSAQVNAMGMAWGPDDITGANVTSDGTVTITFAESNVPLIDTTATSVQNDILKRYDNVSASADGKAKSIKYTRAGHGYVVGDIITVTGASPTRFNVTKKPVIAVTADTFTVSTGKTKTAKGSTSSSNAKSTNLPKVKVSGFSTGTGGLNWNINTASITNTQNGGLMDGWVGLQSTSENSISYTVKFTKTDDPVRDEHEFVNQFLEATVVKSYTETPSLYNMFFYKTVSDDCGGVITSWQQTATTTKISVDPDYGHKLSVGDRVKIDLPVQISDPDDVENMNEVLDSLPVSDGSYEVLSISGNDIYLRGGGNGGSGTMDATYAWNTIGLANPKVVPYRLWSGLSNILVDSGEFYGQYRTMAEENPTVYDLGVEYVNIGTARRFYIYLNNKQIATVDDPYPLPEFTNIALFSRGSSKVMFENVYALGQNYSQSSDTQQVSADKISSIFGSPNGINASDALNKYALSGFVQSSYLSGVNNQSGNDYHIYYDEFGTIMREAAYFNIKYDKAFPALTAQISPTFTGLKGYTVSGFNAGSYGAEFLVFNCLDTLLSLTDSTGNYLRIQGITFTQNATQTLTVDEYLKNTSSISTTKFQNNKALTNPLVQQKRYDTLRASRMKYGKSEFQLQSDYIQTTDQAEALMSWILEKVSRPRKNMGVDMFPNPMVQLGDLANFKMQKDGVDMVISSDKQLVVYQIEYDKSSSGTSMTAYLTEV